ncbi:MAG: IS1 family transposase [Richelia sp. RM2_1_2]|nr:IS1 family transposase [Richelia sp. RM2_1_2]
MHHERHELKQEGFTDRSVLAVFDEFDKQHSDDDKEQAKKIMTAIRHSNQRQILIGQCAEVGSNGWAWDDMKNCSLLVLGASIGSLCKHLTKDLGWTKKKENQVKREYERFSTWADNQNANNPDIPDENQTRIGLLVTGDRYQFLEIPIAHKGILRSGKATFRDTLTATSLSINTQNQHSSNNNSSLVVESNNPVVRCPYCTSTNLVKNGKHKTTGNQLYTCKDCTQTPKGSIPILQKDKKKPTLFARDYRE